MVMYRKYKKDICGNFTTDLKRQIAFPIIPYEQFSKPNTVKKSISIILLFGFVLLSNAKVFSQL
jgi:hypothetical protein